MKERATKSSAKSTSKASRFRNRDLPGPISSEASEISNEAGPGSNETFDFEGSAGEASSGDADPSRELRAPARGGARAAAPSLKERMREARRDAYQRAKAWRAQDPRQIALKESAKLRRREQYQQVKQRRKEALSVTRAAESARRAQAESEVRGAFQAGRAKAPPVQRLSGLRPDVLMAALQLNQQAEAEVANDVS